MPTRLCEQLKRTLSTVLLAVFPALAGAQGTGSDALADALAMQERILEARQHGNAEEAWNLEQELLSLAVRHPDDMRSARILRAVGDHRTDTLARYDAGEYPPEIILGCYYSSTGHIGRIAQRGSQSLSVGPGSNAGSNTCATGSRGTARRALAEDALVFYVEAARIVIAIGNAAGDEVRALFMKLLEASYRTANYGVGRRGLESLLTLQEANSEAWLARAQTLAFMGDWDLLFAEYFGTKYVDSAAAAYAQSLALLTEHSAPEVAVSSIFSPQTPFLLPAFEANRLVSPQTADSTGHVEVSFEIRDTGRSARVRILDSSADASRSAIRDLVNTIRQGRFRPIAADGRLLESAPVTVRYFLED